MTEARNLIYGMSDLVFSWLISVIIPSVEISIAMHNALSLASFPFLISDDTFFFFCLF